MMPSLERYHLPSSGYCIIDDYLSIKERSQIITFGSYLQLSSKQLSSTVIIEAAKAMDEKFTSSLSEALDNAKRKDRRLQNGKSLALPTARKISVMATGCNTHIPLTLDFTKCEHGSTIVDFKEMNHLSHKAVCAVAVIPSSVDTLHQLTIETSHVLGKGSFFVFCTCPDRNCPLHNSEYFRLHFENKCSKRNQNRAVVVSYCQRKKLMSSCLQGNQENIKKELDVISTELTYESWDDATNIKLTFPYLSKLQLWVVTLRVIFEVEKYLVVILYI